MVTLTPALSPNREREVAIDLKSLNLEGITAFDQWLKSFFINPALNYVFATGWVDWFRKVSGNRILNDLKTGPGSWKSMLAHYDAVPKNWVDHLVNRYISFPSGLRNRQKLVISALSQLIESYGKNGPLYLVGIGSGSGNNTLQSIKIKKSQIVSVKAQLFDLNEEAMSYGRVKARELGMDREVNFIHADALEVEKLVSNPPQVIEMIGLIEYLSDDVLIRLMQSIQRFRAASSSILISSISDVHGIDRFLKRILRFDLNYRSAEKITQLLSEFGYKRFNVFPEPTGLFSVVVGYTN